MRLIRMINWCCIKKFFCSNFAELQDRSDSRGVQSGHECNQKCSSSKMDGAISALTGAREHPESTRSR